MTHMNLSLARVSDRWFPQKRRHMDINDPDSIAFQYLCYLNDQGAGEKGGGPIANLGWDLGLTNNEIKDVAQYLKSLGMIELRSGSREWWMSKILSFTAVISESGRQHVRMLRG